MPKGPICSLGSGSNPVFFGRGPVPHPSGGERSQSPDVVARNLETGGRRWEHNVVAILFPRAFGAEGGFATGGPSCEEMFALLERKLL